MAAKVIYDRLVFHEGDEIFAEGEVGNWAYLIQSGKIEISKKGPDGIERMLAMLGPGRLFGEMALIDDQPRMATARATCETTLVLIDRDVVLGKIRNSPPLVRELLQNLSINLRSQTRRQMNDSKADPAKQEARPYLGNRQS